MLIIKPPLLGDPLKKIVRPNDIVVIKPNAVWDINVNKSESIFAEVLLMVR